MPSEKLRSWHSEHCPSIDINSIEFTQYLIAEIEKLKNKVQRMKWSKW